MKKVLLGIFITILFIGISIWSPWLYIKVDLPQLFGVNKPENIAGLQVNALAGEMEVYLDGELKGVSSADKSPLILDRIVPGDYLVTLKRVTKIKGSYWDFNKLVTFTPRTTIIVSYNLGPEEEFSEGQIIYATTKENSSEESKLRIDSSIDDIKISVEDMEMVKLNSKQYEGNINFDKPRTVKVSKDGYDTLEFKILPDSEDERNALKEYNINIDIQLMLQPITIE